VDPLGACKGPSFATASQQAELLDYRAYWIRLMHAGLEWMSAVALDRNAAISKAYEWIELQLRSGKSPS
jgi:phospholipase C